MSRPVIPVPPVEGDYTPLANTFFWTILDDSVSLEAKIKVIELVDAGIEKTGEFIYEAELADLTTVQTYLHIEIKFFDSSWPLDFALFTGE